MKKICFILSLICLISCQTNTDNGPKDIIEGEWVAYRWEALGFEEGSDIEKWIATTYSETEPFTLVFYNNARWESIHNNEVVTSDGSWKKQSENIYWIDANDECAPDCDPIINVVTLLCDDILVVTIEELESAPSIRYYRRVRKDECPEMPYKVID